MPGRLPELDVAIRAARQAGDAVMEIYRRGFETVSKDDGSPVTEGDLKSHEIICRALSETGHGILSEEGYDAAADDRRGGPPGDAVWMVDPLDGTADFVERTTGEFTVMIALVRDTRPVLGVIDWPAGGTLFAAQQGRGAFRHRRGSWQRISVSGVDSLRGCRMVGSRHHLSDRERLFIEGLGVRDFANVGSSLKAARISSGEAEAYITSTNRIKEWDTAASHCIITESGGRMTDVLGNDIAYNAGRGVRHENGILATNGLVHDRIVGEFRRLY